MLLDRWEQNRQKKKKEFYMEMANKDVKSAN
jgi:hypothetical protein